MDKNMEKADHLKMAIDHLENRIHFVDSKMSSSIAIEAGILVAITFVFNKLFLKDKFLELKDLGYCY